MTRAQHAIIRAAYLAGDPVSTIAMLARATIPETETYLAAWCGQGCPEGGLP